MKPLTLFFTLLLATCSIVLLTHSKQTLADDDAAAAQSGYIIQPGDILEISVWKEDGLQREVLVRPDGGLNFPLAGHITVTGKTVQMLQEEITTKLSRFVPEPVVTVMTKQLLGNKIYVLGKVNRAGEYVVNRNIDVMQALSIAGGLNPYAAENNIRILRREHGKLKAIPFEYSRVKEGENLEQNIILKSGDLVVVP